MVNIYLFILLRDKLKKKNCIQLLRPVSKTRQIPQGYVIVRLSDFCILLLRHFAVSSCFVFKIPLACFLNAKIKKKKKCKHTNTMRMWVFLYSPHSLAQLRASSLLGAELQLRKARRKVCYSVPETAWKIKAQEKI